MPATTYRNHATASALKQMKVLFIKICTEFHLVNVVAAAYRYRLAGYGRKAVVVRILLPLGYHQAAEYLVYVPLPFLRIAARTASAVVVIVKIIVVTVVIVKDIVIITKAAGIVTVIMVITTVIFVHLLLLLYIPRACGM
jgi:hypothetical protein